MSRYTCFYHVHDTQTRLNKILESIEKNQASEAAELILKVNDATLEMVNAINEAKNIFNTSNVLTYDMAEQNIRAALDELNQEYEDKAKLLSCLKRIIQFAEVVTKDKGDWYSTINNYGKVRPMTNEFDFLSELRAFYPDKTRSLTFMQGKVSTRSDDYIQLYKDMNKAFVLESYVQADYMYDTNDVSVFSPEPSRIVQAQIHEMSISNKVFDMIYVPFNFEIDLVFNGNQVANRSKTAVIQFEKYLRPGGLFVSLIPAYGFTKDYAMTLSKYFNRLMVKEYIAGHDGMRAFYLIAGVKKLDNYIIERQTANEWRMWHYEKTLQENTWDTSKKISVLPPLEIDLFRTVNINDQDIVNITNASGLMTNFKDRYHNNKQKDDMTPLLPFNTGQIGLVLASGQLDGVVDEKNGFYHVIKGRIMRVKETKSYEEDGFLNESTTTSSRVQINLFLPDGTYKTIV